MGFRGGSEVKNPPANGGDLGSVPGSERALKEEMSTHSSVLAWEIPCTEGPDGLQPMRSQRSQTQLSHNKQLGCYKFLKNKNSKTR